MRRSDVRYEPNWQGIARQWLLTLVVLVTLSLFPGVSPALAQPAPRSGERPIPGYLSGTSPSPAPQGGDTNREEQFGTLYKELAEALIRLRTYLSYYDQIERMGVAQGRIDAAEAEARLKTKGRELYSQAYSEDDLRGLLEQHREALIAYFQHIEQEVSKSTRWPSDAPAEAYQARARSTLELLRRDYEARAARQLDTLPVLVGFQGPRLDQGPADAVGLPQSFCWAARESDCGHSVG